VTVCNPLKDSLLEAFTLVIVMENVSSCMQIILRL